MADNEIQTPPEATAQAEPVAPIAAKKTPRSQSARQKSRAAVPDTAKQTSRGLSEQEKQEKLNQVDSLLSAGTTLKEAVKSVGISDQTYYVWKKTLPQTQAADLPASTSEETEFAEFVQLEEENRRLRKLLSEKLRAENADLRKRLGLK